MNYHKIEKTSIVNGIGLRVVLWLSGCRHHCKNCQNPQTWNKDSGILFDDNAEKELFDEINKDYISGITLSGGDPLHKNNLNGVLNLVNKIRLLFPEKTIWLYTGYTWETIMNRIQSYSNIMTMHPIVIQEENDMLIRQRIIDQCDVVVDGRYIDGLRDISLRWRGSSNQRVINVKESIKKGGVVLWTE